MNTGEQLDLATVIRLSQAVAGEIVLEKLIDMLLRTAIAQAGADRGLLIRLRGADPWIEAEAATGGGSMVVRLCDRPATAELLAQSVLQHVLCSGESVVLDDGPVASPFADDPYVA